MSNLKSFGGLVKEEEKTQKENISRSDLIGQRIIGLILNHSELVPYASGCVEYFSPVYKEIFTSILGGAAVSSAIGFDELASLASLRASFELGDLEEGRMESEFKELLRQLKLEYFKEKGQRLSERVRIAEAGGDKKEHDQALKEFDSVSKEIQNIKQIR